MKRSRPSWSGLWITASNLPASGLSREQVKGFTAGEVAASEALIQRLAHIIFELARDGGFEQAAVISGRQQRGLLGINESPPMEPVHVHIPQVRSTPDATKVWITESGKCLLQTTIPEYRNVSCDI